MSRDEILDKLWEENFQPTEQLTIQLFDSDNPLENMDLKPSNLSAVLVTDGQGRRRRTQWRMNVLQMR